MGIVRHLEGGGGSGTGWAGEVATFSALPDASLNLGNTYLVTETTGSRFTFNLKQSGFYRSNGSEWEKINEVQFILSDDQLVFQDNTDTTKRLSYELNAIPTGTLITATWQGTNGTVAWTSDIITNHSGLTLDDGTNPHSTTKADVGLGNVVNIDTTITANITDSLDKRFITDTQQTNLNNTSGVNTGDEVSATEVIEGIAEISTQTEVNNGVDDTTIVTPLKLEDKTYGVFSGDIITDNSTLKTALQELETATELGVEGIGSILSTVTGIDTTTIGNTSLFTIPSGKEGVVRHLIVRLKTISGAGSVPKVSIGTNLTTFDNIITSQSLSGLTTVGDAYTFIVTGVHHVAGSAEVITLRVNNASSYTTYTIDVDLVGYTI